MLSSAWWRAALGVAGGQAAELLEAVEAAFHHVELLVAFLVEGRR
jgi:hypothetical protein